MKLYMRHNIRHFSRIAFLILIVIMGLKFYAYALNSSADSITFQEGSLGAMSAASSPEEMELPTFAFTDDDGSSFLSRVFRAVLLAGDQETTRLSETTPFPAVSPKKSGLTTPEKELTTPSPEQSGSRSALRALLLFGTLAISWGLIGLLALRLFLLKHKYSEQSIETETITSTGYQILGDIAAENHKFQLAEQCYRKIAEKESYNKEIHYHIGKVLFQAEHYHEAIREFQIALGSEMIPTDIYGFLSKAYHSINQPEQAAQYSQRTMQFNTPTPAPRKKETRNVIPLQKHFKNSKIPRQVHKLSA